MTNREGELYIFSTSNGVLLKKLVIPDIENVSSVAVQIDSKQQTILLGTMNELMVYEMTKSEKPRSVQIPTPENGIQENITSLSTNYDGTLVLAKTETGMPYYTHNIRLFETATLRSIPLDIPKRRVVCASFAAKANDLAIVDFNRNTFSSFRRNVHCGFENKEKDIFIRLKKEFFKIDS